MELIIAYLWRPVAQLIVLAICGIPLWIFLAVKDAAHADGFWQNLVLYGAGIYILGGIQIFLFVVFLVASFAIWASAFERY